MISSSSALPPLLFVIISCIFSLPTTAFMFLAFIFSFDLHCSLLCCYNWFLYFYGSARLTSLPTSSSCISFPFYLPLSFFFKAKQLSFSSTPSFQILSGVMLEVLSEDFPEFFTAEVQVVWTKLMGAVYWHVTGAYTDVGWLQVSSSAV